MSLTRLSTSMLEFTAHCKVPIIFMANVRIMPIFPSPLPAIEKTYFKSSCATFLQMFLAAVFSYSTLFLRDWMPGQLLNHVRWTQGSCSWNCSVDFVLFSFWTGTKRSVSSWAMYLGNVPGQLLSSLVTIKLHFAKMLTHYQFSFAPSVT